VFALALLLLWPIAELFVAIKVAELIGVLWTLLLLIAGWPLCAWALRAQGGAAWRRMSMAVSEGRAPGTEVLDGALVVVGGVLLMIPGFITDVLGILALLPPTRALARGALVRNLRSRLVVQAARFGQRAAGGRRRAHDVDSTARDLDQSRLSP
jgi:UPF0716 protein FxsA